MNKSLIIIPFLFFAGIPESHSQGNVLEEAEEYYKSQAMDSCLRPFHNENNELYQIILIRHGEPDLSKKKWRKRTEAEWYAHAYDSVGVKAFDPLPLCPDGLPISLIYHSNLPRAAHTAQLTFGDRYVMVEDARFREFERKVVRLFNVKLPLGFWMGLSRGLWFLGLNDKGIENFKDARQRARENAEFLADHAEEDKLVILVAHGMHNKYVGKYLKKIGWKQVRKGGSGYTSVNIYAKVKPSE